MIRGNLCRVRKRLNIKVATVVFKGDPFEINSMLSLSYILHLHWPKVNTRLNKEVLIVVSKLVHD